MQEILNLPEQPERVINEYLSLPLGGKSVVCPYFMNLKKQRGGLRVLIGKGDPGEIVREVKVSAKLKGFDLEKANEAQIRQFMIDRGIGIDCSGFIFHVLNYWLRSTGKQPLIKYLKFKNNGFIGKLRRLLRPIENVGANLLTNDDNCERIEDLNQILPGDLIRSKGRVKNSHHVSLIRRVVKEDGQVKEFEYIHSMRYYDEENGLRTGKVIITNPGKGLKDQEWTEVKNGMNWTYNGLMKEYEDNGIRRLKRIELN